MDTRREFIKKAALLSGAAGVFSALPSSIQKAMAIDPGVGSTYLDAEHIVILMQENRSFDHSMGMLRGVRGFNDPRAITLPDQNLVWMQTDAHGDTYAPFRLNMKDTKATWMGSLPHSWTNQVDARNEGKYDKWLQAKPSGNKEYADMPLTMGYYNREDLPFYYALADAFTICDQNFCSCLTGTTPNRLYLWTGTIRDEQHTGSPAKVRNEDVDYGAPASWTTFPERLEDSGISWKIYQNEVSIYRGFNEEEDAWLANFTDNPLEWFEQYGLRFSAGYHQYIAEQIPVLPHEIETLRQKAGSLTAGSKEFETATRQLKQKESQLEIMKGDQVRYSREAFDKLPERLKSLHEKAYSTNKNDPSYHHLTTLRYQDGDTEREVQIPKGDILHQFRDDVKKGTLPTVSWMIAPEKFSDHPTSPWYGAWYISEALDILTENPETWKKTIFILAYDENDGYFDHVPPFVSPHPNRDDTGLTSSGIDCGVEHLTLEQDLKRKPEKEARGGPVGLGYRVPLIIASPWSRGGCVCSEVFDHTSILQFLEIFLGNKSGKKVEETNITQWRRTVCGDLTSVFKPYQGENLPMPSFVAKDAFIESVHKAKFKEAPAAFKKLSENEIAAINRHPSSSQLMPRQEKGVRPSCPLPYELYVDGKLTADKKRLELNFHAKNEFFGKKSSGSPFNVYAPGKYLNQNVGADSKPAYEAVRTWAYAVAAADSLTDSWEVERFENGIYHLRVYGPNGFFRELSGTATDPDLNITANYNRNRKDMPDGNLALTIFNQDKRKKYSVVVKDNAYGKSDLTPLIGLAGSAGGQQTLLLNLSSSFGWYDFTVRAAGNDHFQRRYAGRVETGKEGFSDPAMGGVV